MCGCTKPKAAVAPRAQNESFALSQHDSTLAPGEVLVRWKSPVKRHVRRASVQRGRTYDQINAAPFPMLERDVERYKKEVELVAAPVSTP